MQVGSKYNKLTITSYNGIYKKARSWNCICDCGNSCVVITSSLNNNRKKDCGCEKRKRARKLNLLPKYQAAKNRLWSVYRKKAKKEVWYFQYLDSFLKK